MAKFQKRILARKMRGEGKSIKEIARLLKISKSSVSIWCRDIILTPKQIKRLHLQMVVGGYKGRLKGSQLQKTRKEIKIKNYKILGVENVKSIKNRDLLMLGLGLYFGEGNKTGNKFQFTNSNADIVGLIILWLERVFNIKRKDFILNIIINQLHKFREREVKNYWVKITHTNIHQFNKTIFIKSKSKKVYQNLNEHFGTLIIRVKKSSDLQYKILGLCYGILVKTGIIKAM